MCIEIGMACAMDTGNPAPVRAATHAGPRLIEAAAICGEQVLLRAQQQLLRSSLSEHGMLVVRDGVLSIDTKLVKGQAVLRIALHP